MSDQEKTADELFHMQSFETPEARLAASRLSVEKRQWMIEHMLVEYHTFNVGTKQISTLHKPFDGGTAERMLWLTWARPMHDRPAAGGSRVKRVIIFFPALPVRALASLVPVRDI